jgi:hypothetical protein
MKNEPKIPIGALSKTQFVSLSRKTTIYIVWKMDGQIVKVRKGTISNPHHFNFSYRVPFLNYFHAYAYSLKRAAKNGKPAPGMASYAH